MFLIFGTTGRVKPLNVFEDDVCGICKNANKMQLHEASRWATFFFIPMIKVYKEYYFVCPHCGASRKVDNKEAKALIKAAKEAGAPAVNKNVRAVENNAAAPQTVEVSNNIDVKELIKSDIERVINSIKDPAILKDSANFDKLYSSLREGLVSKYGDAKLVEQTLNEYLG